MGSAATGANIALDSESAPRKFLGVGIETWVKICVGLIVSILISSAGWVIHTRDSIKDRPTTKVVDEKFQAAEIAHDKAAKPTREKLADHKSILGEHTEDIKALEISSAASAEIHKATKESLEAHTEKLDTIQKSINKVLYRQGQGDP